MWTKGYLTGGEHSSTLEEWDALYRLEGARRRWQVYRWWQQQVAARSAGPAPFIVTWRHAIPNPAHAAWKAELAEADRARQAAYAEELRGRAAARAEERRRRDELWAAMGWATYRDRARWVARERVRGRTLSSIGKDAGISKAFAGQLVGAERRRCHAWRAPRGRVFDPDPMYPRDQWITYALGDDMNAIPDAGAA